MKKSKEELVLSTNKISDRMEKALSRRMQVHSVTRVQWLALQELETTEEVSQKNLAEALEIRQPTVVGLVDRMEKEDLVQRLRSRNNRKINQLAITQKGMDLSKEMEGEVKDFADSIFANVSEDELAVLATILEKVENNLVQMEKKED